ncbi:MAG: hypothetical protein H7147_04355 [Frankiaceae bacterium]|nr:hypothetical protein [Arenimonas sp.]
MSSVATVFRTFTYLQAISLYNGVRQRLLRLRQPKYLIGAIAGIAYFYFFVIRHFFDRSIIQPGAAQAVPGQIMPLLALFAGAGILIFVVIAWLLPGNRAALQFNEAEVAFLFPAPLSRVALIQFSLLRSQLTLFFSAFLMSLVLGRGGALGGNPLHHALAIWLILATVKLHFVGASFGRERLLDLGVRPLLRRAIVVGLLVALGALCWWWMARNLSLPKKSDLADFAGVSRYVGTTLATRPLSWLLLPFNVLTAPLFATGGVAFYKALVPAALILVAHYLWVVRSHVSFEEASIDHARRRAEKQQARRDGRSGPRNTPAKPRSAPFRLAPKGFAPTAFLWKGLIAAGPFWRMRNWLLLSALVVGLCLWLGADPQTRPLLKVIGLFAGMFAIWGLIAGPMFMQRGLRRTFEYLDVLKASPLRGWQIALGELLSPMAMMAFAQWLLLLILVTCLVQRPAEGFMSASNVISGAIGIALVNLPLCGLMLCLPFAGMLVFPAWLVSPGGREAGVEVMGQRLIFFGVYIVTMAIALLPASIAGGIAYLLVNLVAPVAAALLVGAVFAAAVLAVEFAGAVWWLGSRVDRIDVAMELRQ